MRQYIDIINEAAAKAQTFTLAPGLDPNNYQLTGSMRDIKQWKAMTYEGDTQNKKGVFAPVGYIWISIKDNTIIPISRGDEHHEGGDVVYDLINNDILNIKPKDYVPVFGYGNNYIYYQEDVPKWTAALSRFLSWGGIDGTMKGANDMRKIALTLSQFVAANGDFTIEPGHLAPLGKSFYAHYKALQHAIVVGRDSTVRSAQMAPFKVAGDVLKFLLSHSMALNVGPDNIKKQIAEVRSLSKEGDIQGLSELFFGFDSFKRKIHEELRRHDPKDRWTADTQTAFWGDVPLAVNMLMDL